MIFEIFFVMSSVYISNRFEREAQNDALRNSMQKTFELTYSQILGALILNDTILTQSILDNLSSRDGLRAVLTDSNGLSLEAGLQEGSNLAWHNYSISHAGKTYGNLALGRPTLESFSNLKSFLLLFAMSQIFLLILSTLLLLRWSLENIERPLKEILKFENSAGQSYGNLDLMQKRLPEELKNAAQLFLLNWQQRNVNNTNAAIAKTTQMLAHDVRKPLSSQRGLSPPTAHRTVLAGPHTALHFNLIHFF
jgi:hypothetical protein